MWTRNCIFVLLTTTTRIPSPICPSIELHIFPVFSILTVDRRRRRHVCLNHVHWLCESSPIAFTLAPSPARLDHNSTQLECHRWGVSFQLRGALEKVLSTVNLALVVDMKLNCLVLNWNLYIIIFLCRWASRSVREKSNGPARALAAATRWNVFTLEMKWINK